MSAQRTGWRGEVALERLLQLGDWFIPKTLLYSKSERSLARNFVFTHLLGPLMSQTIVLFLHWTDPDGGWRVWIVTACVWGFWALPFLLRATGDLRLCAFISVQLLAFVSLFGAFNYGGATSPFLPWLIVSLLLAFFYLSRQALLVNVMFLANLIVFFMAYFLFGFSDHVPRERLEVVGWFSIISACIYIGWMALYYTSILSMRNELIRETEELEVTTRRLTETKLLAERANAQRSIFLAKMSHELRTPLNAVIGYSEIIQDSVGDDPQKQQDVGRINAAGKHLLALVTEVLDIGRIERDETIIETADVDLQGLANDIAATARPLIKQNGNNFVIDIAPKIGVARTDATKLRQVVLNLLGNAAKFCQGGTITLIVRRDKMAASDWIEFHVQDTGIGISAEEMPKLFANFGQASASTSSRFGGTGLGLVHSQKLCGLLGGRINVTSSVGQGSLFTVRIPATFNRPQERKSEPSSTTLWMPA
jgi:signal transduction histidine kinase